MQDPGDGEPLIYTVETWPSWITFNSADESFSGTAPLAPSTQEITVKLSDTFQEKIEAIPIHVKNYAPTLSSPFPSVPECVEGIPFSYTVDSSLFTDKENEAMTFSVSVVPVESWIMLDQNTLTVSGTSDVVGSYRITATASDPHQSTKEYIQLSCVVNQPPYINPNVEFSLSWEVVKN